MDFIIPKTEYGRFYVGAVAMLTAISLTVSVGAMGATALVRKI